MLVEVIDSPEALAALRQNWEAVYEADPEAQIYISWAWINRWLSKLNDTWFILAARRSAGEPYVGFFPLQLRTHKAKDGHWYNDIKMGASDFADYYGFICDPKHEEGVTTAFGNHIRRLNWTNLRFEKFYVSAKRQRLLMQPFSKTIFDYKEEEQWMEKNTVHNNLCPHVKLPATWDAYLNEKLSTNTRQKAKRFLKRLDESGEFHISHVTAETLKRDIDILFKMWETTWRPAKGDKVINIMKNYRIMFDAMFESGNMYLPIMWQGERPLAALGTLIDHKKRSMHFVITGRDESFNSPPPGFILHCYSIRHAIQLGFREYDFLTGNEPYKYMFGCEDRYLKWMVFSTKTKQNLGEVLDKRSCEKVFKEAQDSHKAGKIEDAEKALKQVIGADPNFADALYLHGEIEAGRAHDKEAARLFKAYLALKPDAAEAWFKLGKVLQAQGDKEAAIQSFKKVLELDPKNRDAQLLLLNLYPLQTGRPKPGSAPVGILSR